MDPKVALQNIKAYCAVIVCEDPIRMQTLNELEETIYNLRRWIDKGGFVPEGLKDDR